MNNKLALTLTTIATILTLTACGTTTTSNYEEPEPTSTLPTSNPARYQPKAINFCQLETASQTGDPEHTRTSYTNFERSAGNTFTKIHTYTLTGETTLTTNGIITDYINTCTTEVDPYDGVTVLDVTLTEKH